MTAQRNHGARKPRVATLSRWTWEAGEAEDASTRALESLLAQAQAGGLVREYDVTRSCVWFNAPAGERTRVLCADVEVLLPKGWQRAKDGVA